MRLLLTVVVLVAVSGAAPCQALKGSALKDTAAAVEKRAAAEYASLEALYKHFHAHPELSLAEEQTAARLARELKDAGFDVTPKVGGHGVVAEARRGGKPLPLTHSDSYYPVPEPTIKTGVLTMTLAVLNIVGK